MSFGKRLRDARIRKGFTQMQLAEILGAKHNSVSNWEADRNKPGTEMIEKLCELLEITPSYLIIGDLVQDTGKAPSMRKIPILGEIACGKPLFCNQEYDSFIEADINADFALRAKGESMINARIKDGDIVFIKKQPMVQNGEIAAVCIDNEATLKRVYLSGSLVTLVAENPAFSPIVYNLRERTDIMILGKAVAFQSYLA